MERTRQLGGSDLCVLYIHLMARRVGQNEYYYFILVTDPSSRQRGRPTSTNKQLSDSNKNLVLSPRWLLYSNIDWPTDRRS
jgi:hypothetical protein